MKLLSLTIGGFRNLGTTVLEIADIIALVSPNNYGKSNLLNALDLASSFIQASPKVRDEMMSRTDAVPLVKSLEEEPFSFYIEFEDPEAKPDYRFVRYGFSFAWVRDDGTGRRIIDETLLASPIRGRWTSYLRRKEGLYRRGKDTRSFRKISLDDNQLAVDVLAAVDSIEINRTVRAIRSATFAVCSTLDTSPRYSTLPIDIGWEPLSDDDLVFDDGDLPRALYRLKSVAPQQYEDVLFAAYTLFPTFEDISVGAYELRSDIRERLTESITGSADSDEVPLRIKDELYRVTIKDSALNQPVDISRMSSGTKRLFWLLANAIIAGEIGAACIGVEEVETSIHPKMTGQLLEALHESLSGTPLLLTSHSPSLVQYLDPSSVYVGVPSDDGVARFRRISRKSASRLFDNARARGMGYGDYLFDLMSSDVDGLQALVGYLEA